MSHKSEKTPRWKIIVAMLCLGVASPVLFVVAVMMEKSTPNDPGDSGTTALLTLPGFLLILSTAALLLCGATVFWLVYRIREDRKPAWSRKVDKFGVPKK